MPIILKNNNLEVEIGYSGEYYSGSRFDYSGNIRQVILNEKHRFCATEKSSYSSLHGFGFMNEFDIEEPLGYSDAKSGEYFTKIGVGNLKKEDDGRYDFFHFYKKDPLSFEIILIGIDTTIFKSKSKSTGGFQIIYNKKVTIKDNIVSIEYYLKNTGEKPISTNEYCHNFVSVDNTDISSDYELEFDFDILSDYFSESVNIENLVYIKGRTICWTGKPDKEFFIGQFNSNKPVKAIWILRNSVQGAGIKEQGDFECLKVNLWGNTHVVCPELFIRIELMPGEEKLWKREYTFFEI